MKVGKARCVVAMPLIPRSYLFREAENDKVEAGLQSWSRSFTKEPVAPTGGEWHFVPTNLLPAVGFV